VASTPESRVSVPMASIADRDQRDRAQPDGAAIFADHLQRREAHQQAGDDGGDQHARPGEGQIGEVEQRGLGRRLGGDRRHLVDHVVQLGHLIFPDEDRIRPGLERAGAPDQHHHADDDPRQQRAPELRLAELRRIQRLGGRHGRSRFIFSAQRRRQP